MEIKKVYTKFDIMNLKVGECVSSLDKKVYRPSVLKESENFQINFQLLIRNKEITQTNCPKTAAIFLNSAFDSRNDTVTFQALVNAFGQGYVDEIYDNFEYLKDKDYEIAFRVNGEILIVPTSISRKSLLYFRVQSRKDAKNAKRK